MNILGHRDDDLLRAMYFTVMETQDILSNIIRMISSNDYSYQDGERSKINAIAKQKIENHVGYRSEFDMISQQYVFDEARSGVVQELRRINEVIITMAEEIVSLTALH